MLNVEYDARGEVTIILDQDGLERLKRTLALLENGPNHTHLFAPSFGGHELTEASPDEGNVLVYKLTLQRI